jgi:hypothetical protein
MRALNLTKQAATSPVGAAGSYSLGAAASGGFFAADAKLATGEKGVWLADDGAGNKEIFFGALTTGSPATVSRDLCIASTNADAFIAWGGATSVTLRMVPAAEFEQSVHPGYVSGLTYGTILELGNGALVNVPTTINILYCVWCPIFEPVKPSGILSIITALGSAGSFQRLGAYTNVKGRPGTLIVDAGTAAMDAGTLNTNKVCASGMPGPWFKPPGVWLVGTFGTAAPNVRSFASGTTMTRVPFIGSDDNSGTSDYTGTTPMVNVGTNYTAGLPSDLSSATFTAPGTPCPVFRFRT